MPSFAFHELYLTHNPHERHKVIDPCIHDDGTPDIDHLALASKGKIETRVREERARIYAESLSLIELHGENSPAGMLEALARNMELDDHQQEVQSGDEGDVDEE